MVRGRPARFEAVTSLYRLTRRRNAWGEQASYAVPGGRDTDRERLLGLAAANRKAGSWFVIEARPMAVLSSGGNMVGLASASADPVEQELLPALGEITVDFGIWLSGDGHGRHRFEAIPIASVPAAGFAPLRLVSSSGGGRLRWRERPASGNEGFLAFCMGLRAALA